MMASYRKAYVYIRNTFAGVLSETDQGYSFQYDQEYLSFSDSSPVSLTLPKKKKNTRQIFCFPSLMD